MYTDMNAQSNASSETFQDMTKVTAILFAEYINWTLEEDKLPLLADLYEIAGFSADFEAFISTGKRIGDIEITELVASDRTLSTSLIFVNEYLQHGPGFTPILGSDFETSSSYKVLAGWVQSLLTYSEYQIKVGVEKAFDFVAEAAAMVTAPVDSSGKFESTSALPMRSLVMKSTFKPAFRAVARRLKMINLSEKDFESIIAGANFNYKSLVTRLMAMWKLKDDVWHAGASALASISTQSSRQYITGSPIPIGVTDSGPREHRWVEVTTVTGASVSEWMNAGESCTLEES